MKINTSKLIIYTFIITSIWDILLRFMVERYALLPNIIKKYKFLKYLTQYFKQHTLISAALIAGFIGAVVQFIVIQSYPFPSLLDNYMKLFLFLLLSFIISGLFGFIIKESKLFPYLTDSYYKKLGPINAMIHDGVSGIIVQLTLLFLFHIIKL